MLKAILRKGIIMPLEPLPTSWQDGTALEVSQADAPLLDIDAWAESMNLQCADSSFEDEDAMRRVIDAHRQEAKAQTRRAMGLPG